VRRGPAMARTRDHPSQCDSSFPGRRPAHLPRVPRTRSCSRRYVGLPCVTSSALSEVLNDTTALLAVLLIRQQALVAKAIKFAKPIRRSALGCLDSVFCRGRGLRSDNAGAPGPTSAVLA